MPDERLNFMKRIATGAGERIMMFWGTDVRSRYKDDNSVVTEADLRSNEYILGELSRAYPDHGILSEEGEEDPSRLNKPRIFIVDPLDGSGDFKRMEEDFCVLLALAENGVPTLGVVYEPLKNALYFAEKGGKTYLSRDGTTTEIGPPKPLSWERARIGHPKNYKGDKYTRVYKMLGIAEERLVRSGSMGTRMMQVLLQQADMIIGYTRSLKEWDIAAGHVMLEAAGFGVTDIRGNPLRYNQEVPKTHNGVLVAHPGIKDEALKRLEACFDKIEM